MSKGCSHIAGVQTVTPSALGCEECLKSGSRWLHLRICRICGHVGCCDDSPNKHATAHFHATGHPVIEGYDPPEDAAEGADPALLLGKFVRGGKIRTRRHI